MAAKAEVWSIGGREVKVTNLDKVLFAPEGITKREVLEHVVAIAEVLLPGLRDRPLSMERFVDGLAGPGFFHKHLPAHFPGWVRSVTLPTSRGPMAQVVVDDLPTLVLVTNFGCLTPHVPCATVDRPDYPDQLVIDLDPDERAEVSAIRAAGRLTRAALEEVGLVGFPRWSGSKGLHVVVPLDRTARVDAVMRAAEGVAAEIVARRPDLLTLAFNKVDRGGRIYVDLGRNAPFATVVASWALRVRPGAPLAMPVTWDEVDATGPRHFTLRGARERLAGPDPWAGFDAARRAP